MECYRCGASLAELSLPLSRMDECPSCTVYLHACRMCQFFDPAVPKQCREDDANEINAQDKEKANFCDYFRPGEGVFDGSFATAEAKAKDELTALFENGDSDASASGKSASGKDDAVSQAGKLFK